MKSEMPNLLQKFSSGIVHGKYRDIELEESFKLRTHTHAVHVLLWCIDELQKPPVVFAMMGMRSDGKLGFPGGKLEADINEKEVIDALHRELDEEIAYRGPRINMKDYLFSHIGTQTDIVLHFFAKKLTYLQFEDIEADFRKAKDFLTETMGLFRIPLSERGADQYPRAQRFFKKFFRNKFAGNAKQQFIESVLKLGLIGRKDVKIIEKHS